MIKQSKASRGEQFTPPMGDATMACEWWQRKPSPRLVCAYCGRSIRHPAGRKFNPDTTVAACSWKQGDELYVKNYKGKDGKPVGPRYGWGDWVHDTLQRWTKGRAIKWADAIARKLGYDDCGCPKRRRFMNTWGWNVGRSCLWLDRAATGWPR